MFVSLLQCSANSCCIEQLNQSQALQNGHVYTKPSYMPNCPFNLSGYNENICGSVGWKLLWTILKISLKKMNVWLTPAANLIQTTNLKRINNSLAYSTSHRSGHKSLIDWKFSCAISSDYLLSLLISHELYSRLWSNLHNIHPISSPQTPNAPFL